MFHINLFTIHVHHQRKVLIGFASVASVHLRQSLYNPTWNTQKHSHSFCNNEFAANRMEHSDWSRHDMLRSIEISKNKFGIFGCIYLNLRYWQQLWTLLSLILISDTFKTRKHLGEFFTGDFIGFFYSLWIRIVEPMWGVFVYFKLDYTSFDVDDWQQR